MVVSVLALKSNSDLSRVTLKSAENGVSHLKSAETGIGYLKSSWIGIGLLKSPGIGISQQRMGLVT